MSAIKQQLRQRKAEQKEAVVEEEKNALQELIDGYNTNTNQLVKKFDHFVLLPGVILTFTFLGINHTNNF